MTAKGSNNEWLTWPIIATGFGIRYLVPMILPGLTKVLDQSVLFSTPINSYRSLREAIFLSTNSMNPYREGEIVHHPPLILELFKYIKTDQQANVFFALIDTLFGLQLLNLNKRLSLTDIKHGYFANYIVAAFYAFNPLAIFSVFSKSTGVIGNFVFLIALNAFVSNPTGFACMGFLAISTYLNYYSWYFLVPIFAYNWKQTSKLGKSAPLEIAKEFLMFIGVLSILLGISFNLSANSFSYMELVYGTIIKLRKITPNLGLWWYFFTEIFDFFNNFFLGIFNLYTFIFFVPVTIRFIVPSTSTITDALFAIWSEIGILNFSKAYPTIADLNLYFSMILLFKPLYKKLRFPPAVLTLAMFTILLLLPVFYYVWMGANSGNANFFYAIGLTHSLIEIMMVTDFFWSKIQLEYYTEKGVDPDEKKLKLTQI